jgi:predicted amidohydrolase
VASGPICGVKQTLSGVEGGKAYAVEAACEMRNILSPLRAVNVRILWTRGTKPVHPAGILVRGPQLDAGKATFHDVLVAPPEADAATLSLEVKWPEGGSVLFRRVSVRPTDAPPPRKVKVGAVYLRPKNSTPEKNLDLWCAKIDEAGCLGLDIICLGEAILMVGTRASAADVAEAIPGPSTARLGAAAKKNRTWVVAGLYERSGSRIYNTAVLLDRDGRLAGTYRKVHLPREEWTKGITPGTEYPVFKTEFGTVGIQICYDWFFPEAAEIFALKGAEILFAPTWGDTKADQDGTAQGETVFRTRARDNGLYLVPCVYDGSSMVIDPMGRMLVSSKGPTEGVYWSEIDLAKREPLWWVGHWRSIGPRDRMPETYAPLVGRSAQP